MTRRRRATRTHAASPPGGEAPQGGSAGVRWAVAALILAAGAAAYANSFDGAFVYDDNQSIVHNRHIRTLWPLSEAMSLPTWGSGITVDARPVLSLSFALNRALLGEDPHGFHLVNLAIHLAAALLLFGVIRRTLLLPRFRPRWGRLSTYVAGAAALLWVVHPVQTSAVTYIVQRAESMASLFYLLTLYCAIRGFTGGRPVAWYAAAVAACALGTGSKEIIASAPVIVLLYDVVFVAPSARAALRRRWPFYAALAATWGLTALFMIGTWQDKALDFEEISALRYARTQPGAILHYLRMAVWPSPLVADRNWPFADTLGAVVPQAAAVAALLGATAWGLARRRWYGFVGAFFFAVLAPSSSIIPLRQNQQDHRAYLAMASVTCLAVVAGAWGLRRLAAAGKERAWLGLGAAGVLAAAGVLGLLTYGRNRDYHDPLAFWADNVAKCPRSVTAHTNLGLEYDRRGDLRQALEHYRRAVAIDPGDVIANNNLGGALKRVGRWREAIACYERVLRKRPRHAAAMTNLGAVYTSIGKLNEAEQLHRQAIALEPGLAAAHNNLGAALEKQGRFEEAMASYARAVQLKPSYAQAHTNLGAMYVRKGDVARAEEHYRLAIHYRDDYADPHNNLGVLLEGRGDLAAAESHYRRAVRLKPAYAHAHSNLARLLAKTGRRGEAVRHYRTAADLYLASGLLTDAAGDLQALLRILPDDADARAKLRKVVELLNRRPP
jgi:tetratricopeptide (TPR) repeat protein